MSSSFVVSQGHCLIRDEEMEIYVCIYCIYREKDCNVLREDALQVCRCHCLEGNTKLCAFSVFCFFLSGIAIFKFKIASISTSYILNKQSPYIFQSVRCILLMHLLSRCGTWLAVHTGVTVMQSHSYPIHSSVIWNFPKFLDLLLILDLWPYN